MNVSRDPDRLIREFLEEGLSELPDRAYDAVRAQIDHTRQRVVIGPWREEQMNKFAILGVAAASILVVAVLGTQLLPQNGGSGGPPAATPTSTVAPTPTPTAPDPSPTRIADPNGRLDAGTYVAHPFGPPNESMSFTFSVPSASWEAFGDPGQTVGVAWYGDSGGVGLGFLRVTSLNGDPCNWSGAADDVELGSTVDDLVTALTSSDDFEASQPSDVTLGGYSGKKLVVTLPGDLLAGGNTQPRCDEQLYMIWNAEGFDIYAQGPENLWTLWILDVDGERVVVQRSEFADSPSVRRLELDSIVDSIEIAAP